MEAQPLIAVRDVAASAAWFARLLGCRTAHGGAEYERMVDAGGRLVLQLHLWDAHDDPHLGDADAAVGNGVLLWFRVDDFPEAVGRAGDLGAEILEGPRFNPNAGHREVWIREPHGYTVVLASAPGDR